jgi:hypothetical protein
MFKEEISFESKNNVKSINTNFMSKMHSYLMTNGVALADLVITVF